MTVLLLRLSSLRDTAASSTHRLLADLVCAADPAAEVDFAFLPPKRAPRVTGLFSGRALPDFDLILATNSFVQEAINLPWLLRANGVDPWASDRPEAFPPLLLGGSNAFAAQCLVRPDGAAVPDLLFFGEAEAVLPTFIARWQSACGTKRERLGQAAASLDGFWVTGAMPEPGVRQAVARVPPPRAALLPLTDTEATGTVRLAVGSGCAAFCSFCFEGFERKPYREQGVGALLAQAASLKQACGARAVELDAFNLNHYTGLAELVGQCARLFDRISFKSQRADGIAACPEIVDLERAAGKSSYTLGIEGISPRMRAFLSKALSDDEIAVAVKALLDRRVRELKLFFILTAHEGPDDLAAFSGFCARLKGWLSLPSACTRVVLSFGRLVRMPNTPLAHDRLFLEEAEWRFCVDGVAAACRRAGLEHRFALDWPDYLGTQLLAACGHESADAVAALACEGLSRHEPWRAQDAARLLEALEPVAARGTVARCFPFVRRAVSDAFLLQRWEEAKQALDGGYCLGQSCLGCGACADAAETATLTARSRSPQVNPEVIADVARIESDKRKLTPVHVRTTLPAEFSGHSPAWVSARLMQVVLTRHPDQTANLLSMEEALFSPGENGERTPVPAGETVIACRAWDAAALVSRLVSPHGDSLSFVPQPAPFAPGAFAEATWDIHTRTAPREAARIASEWLGGLRLPHTLRRADESWNMELAQAALKKRCVFSVSVAPEREGACVTLRFSPKAAVRDLLARLPPSDSEAHARCRSFTLPG